MSWIALTLVGSGLRPSVDMMWPKYPTVNLSGLSFTEVVVMFFPCSSGDDDVIDRGCDTRQALKRLVHLLLEFILRADDSERQSKKSVSAVWGVESGQVRRL